MSQDGTEYDKISFNNSEPNDVKTLLKIDGRDYALVEWGTMGLCYVPYEWIKKNYPSMLMRFFSSHATIKHLTSRKNRH